MKRSILIALCLLMALPGGGFADTRGKISSEEARVLLETASGLVLLDVRTLEEYRAGHIPGAINLPNERITGKATEEMPDKAQTIVVYCRTGSRSAMAAQKLTAMGYTSVLDMGGILDWSGELVEGEESGVYPRAPLRMMIGSEEVSVEWEDNASAEALRALAIAEPMEIAMTMYGGFEQVGPIGESLPRADEQTTTQPGDIVLYSGNQIVVFYGSNSWAYTRLGRISDRSAEELASLLGAGDVTIVLDASGHLTAQGDAAPFPEAQEAFTLTFSSFDGGGPEYSVEIADEGIVACARERKYESAEHEMMTGSAYQVFLTFTGIAPGETRVTIKASSPIAENWETVYAVRVDGDLGVSMYPTGELESLYFYRGGYTVPISFEIAKSSGAYTMRADDGPARPLSVDVADALYAVICKYDLWLWDGFNEAAEGVLDGEGFALEFSTAGGASVSAHGDNSFPEHYWDAMGEIESLLRIVSGLDW